MVLKYEPDALKNSVVCVIGNMADLTAERKVEKEEIMV
jgi:hypothetical protein